MSSEQVHDLIGRRTGGDIIVFGCVAQQLIANAASGKQRLISGCAKLSDDGQCKAAAW
jgi:hypothetical protein